MARRPYNAAWYKKLLAELKRNPQRCALCGLPGATSPDHIIPLSKGGLNVPSNIQPVHRRCNSSRGNRTTTRETKPW